MTPQLEAAIAASKPLDQSERQQLIQILIEDTQSDSSELNLQIFSTQFWQGISIGKLRSDQMPSTSDRQASFANFWPEEDTDQEFLDFLKQQRVDDTNLNGNESFAN